MQNMKKEKKRQQHMDVVVSTLCNKVITTNNFKESEHFKEPSAVAPGISAQPKPGDLIEISRDFYQHWALHSGEGKVIHKVPPSEHADAGVSSVKSVRHNKAIVKKEKLQDVVGSDDYRIHNVLDKQHPPLPIPHILQKAETLVGMVVPYKLLTDNCEHFVKGLRNGVPQSQQVRKAAAASVAVIAVVCCCICFALYFKRQSKVYSLLGFISLLLFLFVVFFLVFTIA
ncbi:HRAS-like suppressor 3 isoform X2 [Sinocyclocheilus anshuiensis]|uniref:HRAS-like suppressor 3 isoform X2 n=1 Tax=Sinocyclocheilus anshuiensis TaxID=1608454 RepID=UPI0007BA1406|nr:PREDICTED: HRAS-like suppressor 3 isoform X2 [Sinocyclocheilus anshuiensis]